VTWSDPRLTSDVAGTIAGLEFLQRIVRGELPGPPIASLMNFSILEVERGRVVFGMEAAEYLYNPIGVVHGGVASTIMDSAMGCAVHSMLPAGVGYTTTDLQVRFVRAITATTGRLLCEGKVVHAGAQVMTTEGRLTDEAGAVYAHGTGSCLLLKPRPPVRRPMQPMEGGEPGAA
jgi:uncharacterized protein (TIGR00369 family)